jgi:hypothetical protein
VNEKIVLGVVVAFVYADVSMDLRGACTKLSVVVEDDSAEYDFIMLLFAGPVPGSVTR